jgi:hypothetical protein
MKLMFGCSADHDYPHTTILFLVSRRRSVDYWPTHPRARGASTSIAGEAPRESYTSYTPGSS